tara:strand:+ start:150 stop:770 length:621 start_codon:yes stop_codon:yes gene_type:complete
MKSLLLASILSSTTFSQEPINLREYLPIDDFITPKIYVYDSNRGKLYKKYHSIPLQRRDTLVITEYYQEGSKVFEEHKIYSASSIHQLKRIYPNIELEVNVKGNNRLSLKQSIGKTNTFKTEIDGESSFDIVYHIFSKNLQTINEEVYEAITIKHFLDKYGDEEDLTYESLGKGVGTISIVSLNGMEYLLSDILSEEDFNKIKCEN